MKVHIPNEQSKYIGKCIYCLETGTQKEHVVPIAFGGYHVLLDGSCKRCANMTRDVETELCEHNFNAIRFHQGYPRARGRKAKREPDLKFIEGETPHDAPFRKLRANEVPGTSVFPILRPPGIMRGRALDDQDSVLTFWAVDSSGDGTERQRKLTAAGYKGALAYGQIRPLSFMRELAKIAHGYAVWNVGLNGFSPLLLPIIDGTAESTAGYLIGGNFPDGPLTPYMPTPTANQIYQISPFQIDIGVDQYIGCQMRLFATVRPLTPVYIVIFGKPLT
jgi:hypothetical protein